MASIKVPINPGDYKLTGAEKVGPEGRIELRPGRAVAAVPGLYAITGAAVPLHKRLKTNPGTFAITGYENRLMQWRLAISQRGDYMLHPPRHFGATARIYLGYAPGLFAFPSDTMQGIQMGLSLRQYYAAQAMNGLMANSAGGNLPPETIAVLSFGAADAMLFIERRERERSPLTVQNLVIPAVWPAPGANPKLAPPPQQAPVTVSEEEVAELMAQQAKKNGEAA